ncbi:MAG: hypothetical protein U0169_27055 [Polyangiaceae bacterium]
MPTPARRPWKPSSFLLATIALASPAAAIAGCGLLADDSLVTLPDPDVDGGSGTPGIPSAVPPKPTSSGEGRPPGDVEPVDASTETVPDVGTRDVIVVGDACRPDTGCSRKDVDVPDVEDDPVVHEVTFDVHNGTSSDVWVVEYGWFCDAFQIEETPSFAHLDLSEGFQCGCECANPGPPFVQRYRRVVAGTTESILWDGRALESRFERLDCADAGWPGSPQKSIVRYTPRPAPAGNYHVTLPFARTLPVNCVAIGSSATCTYGARPNATPPPSPARVCASSDALSADFSTRTFGDVRVAVEVPPR